MATAPELDVTFVYANARERLQAEVAAGVAPDTGLLGENHLARLGIRSRVHTPLLQRSSISRLQPRLAWHLREVVLPFEVPGRAALIGPFGPIAPLVASIRRRPPVIVLNMGLCTRFDRSPPLQRRLLAAGIRRTAAVVCFAEAQRAALLAQTGADPTRVHTLLLGVDERFLRAKTPASAGRLVLAVGRDLGRDYGTFLAAIDGLEAEVVLVASPRNLEGLRVPPNVRVLLDVSALELRGLYEAARCVVIPTRREGFSFGADCSGQNVLVDAMAMGRPVVASERSTLRDYVDHGETALVVPAEDAAALRAGIEDLLADPAQADAMGARCRARVEAGLTTAHFAGRVARLVAQVLAERV